MTTTTHTVIEAVTKVPAYCTSGHGVLTQAEWSTCWKLGWNQSTTGTATAGASVGHYAAPVLAILAIVLLVAAISRRRSPAAQRS